MRDFSIKQCIPTHRLSSQLCYDAKHKTFLVNGAIIPLDSIKWCRHSERRGTFYWEKIHSITFWYNDKEPGMPAYLYHRFVDDIPYSADVIEFFKSLGLTVVESAAEEKLQEERYCRLRAEIYYEEHKEEIELQKQEKEKRRIEYEKKMEWRRKNVWPIVKIGLIGFYALFAIGFIVAIFVQLNV